MNPVLPDGYRPPEQKGLWLQTCKGVQIGITARPRMPHPDEDGGLVQEALLEPRTARPLRLIQRAAGAVWRWL